MRLWIVVLMVAAASMVAVLDVEAKPGRPSDSAGEAKSRAHKSRAEARRSKAKADKSKAKAGKSNAKADKSKAKADKSKAKAGKSKAKAGKSKAKAGKSGTGAAKPAQLFADILVLHATNSKKGIDPRIGEMPELSKPPFSAYSTYSLLKRARVPLKKDRRQQVDLPNGTGLRIELRERLAGDLVRLAAAITRPKGEEILPLLEVKARVTQRFVVAGQSHNKGILVLVIRPVR